MLRNRSSQQGPGGEPRPAFRTNFSGGVPDDPPSECFNTKNIVEIWDAIAENWSATVAAAKDVTSAKQREGPAEKPCQPYAKESLDAALRDQASKLSWLQASITAVAAASQRLVLESHGVLRQSL